MIKQKVRLSNHLWGFVPNFTVMDVCVCERGGGYVVNSECWPKCGSYNFTHSDDDDMIMMCVFVEGGGVCSSEQLSNAIYRSQYLQCPSDTR